MLHYDILGNGDPLILLHGLGSRKEAWRSQYELADNYRLIIPDLRGHGESEITHGITVKNFAKDIIELMDDLEIEKAVIGGLSMGGIVALTVGSLAPDRCKSLILANTCSFMVAGISHWSVWERYSKLATLTDEQYIEQLVKHCLGSASSEEILNEMRNAFKINRSTYIPSAWAFASIFLDIHMNLPNIDIPTLVIGGEKDKVTIPLLSEIMASRIKGSTLKILKNTGHLSNIENKEEFNIAVRDFLK